jgi:hypothetical protein
MHNEQPSVTTITPNPITISPSMPLPQASRELPRNFSRQLGNTKAVRAHFRLALFPASRIPGKRKKGRWGTSRLSFLFQNPFFETTSGCQKRKPCSIELPHNTRDALQVHASLVLAAVCAPRSSDTRSEQRSFEGVDRTACALFGPAED